MRPASEQAPTEDISVMEQVSRRARRGIVGEFVGYIDYIQKYLYLLGAPYPMHDRREFADPFAVVQWRNDLAYASFGDHLLDRVCEMHSVEPPQSLISVSSCHAELLAKGYTNVLKVSAISRKNQRCHNLLNAPPYQDVKAWVRQLTDQRQHHDGDEEQSQATSSGLLHLPTGIRHGTSNNSTRFGKGAEDFDPVNVLKWLRFARHLHACESTVDAIEDGIDARIDDETLKCELKEKGNRIPKKLCSSEAESGWMHRQ